MRLSAGVLTGEGVDNSPISRYRWQSFYLVNTYNTRPSDKPIHLRDIHTYKVTTAGQDSTPPSLASHRTFTASPFFLMHARFVCKCKPPPPSPVHTLRERKEKGHACRHVPICRVQQAAAAVAVVSQSCKAPRGSQALSHVVWSLFA